MTPLPRDFGARCVCAWRMAPPPPPRDFKARLVCPWLARTHRWVPEARYRPTRGEERADPTLSLVSVPTEGDGHTAGGSSISSLPPATRHVERLTHSPASSGSIHGSSSSQVVPLPTYEMSHALLDARGQSLCRPASARTLNTHTLRGADTCGEGKAGRGGAAGTGGVGAGCRSRAASPRWTVERPRLLSLTLLPPR